MRSLLALLITVGLAGAMGCDPTEKLDPPDAGQSDGGPPDAGVADAGFTGGPVTACATGYAGCAAYTDLSAGSRTVTWTFTPVPQCVQLKAGQTLQFNGASANHPLSQGCGVARVTSDHSTGPVPFVLTFPTAGDYGFYCDFHGTAAGVAMALSVRVVP